MTTTLTGMTSRQSGDVLTHFKDIFQSVLHIERESVDRFFDHIDPDMLSHNSVEYWIERYFHQCESLYNLLIQEEKSKQSMIKCFKFDAQGASYFQSITDPVFRRESISYWIYQYLCDQETREHQAIRSKREQLGRERNKIVCLLRGGRDTFLTQYQSPHSIGSFSSDNILEHWDTIMTEESIMIRKKPNIGPQHILLFHAASQSVISKILYGAQRQFGIESGGSITPGINVALGAPHQDFSDGRGFYLYECEQDARQWAQQHYPPGWGMIVFLVDRDTFYDSNEYYHLDFDILNCKSNNDIDDHNDSGDDDSDSDDDSTGANIPLSYPSWSDFVLSYRRQGRLNTRVSKWEHRWSFIRGNILANVNEILDFDKEWADIYPKAHAPSPKKQWVIKNQSLADAIFDCKICVYYWDYY
jgi:hypothetical protein